MLRPGDARGRCIVSYIANSECYLIHGVGRLLWFILACVSCLFYLYIDYGVQNICFLVTDEHCITRMCIVRPHHISYEIL